MNDFGLFFQMGYEHIADLKGIDHIMFVAAPVWLDSAILLTGPADV